MIRGDNEIILKFFINRTVSIKFGEVTYYET